MQTSALFQAAAEIFHADPRVRAMPYSEHDGEHVFASTHHLEEDEEAPAGYDNACLYRLDDGGFMAFFPTPNNFLEGPVSIRWGADGTRTDCFQFDGEEYVRTLTGHERLRYEAHKAKARQAAAPVAEAEGIALVQPETIAAAMDVLGDAIAAAEAEVWRDNERGGEGHHVAAYAAACEMRRAFVAAVVLGDAGTVQRIAAQVEELAA